MANKALSHIISLTILIVAAACDGGGLAPGLGFDHALVQPACGPLDGPAVTIVLAAHPVDPRSPAPPYIRIAVWAAPETVGGRTWGLGGSGDTASALLVRSANDYESATAGQVILGVIDTTSTTDGSAELVFRSIGVVSGDFRATWNPAAPLCG